MNSKLFKNILTGFAIALLAVSCIVVIKGWLDGNFSTLESFRAYIAAYGVWGPMILILLQTIQVIIPVIPSFLGYITGAAMFGTWGGFWVNYIGICAGSIIAYWLARVYGVALVKQLIPLNKYDSFVDWIKARKSYDLMLFLCILLPLAPDDFLCYFSGLAKTDAKRFTWIIIVAKPWCILFYSIFFTHFM